MSGKKRPVASFPALRRSSMSVEIAYSPELETHVLAFGHRVDDSKRTLRTEHRDWESNGPLNNLVQPKTLRGLLECAEFFGPLFDIGDGEGLPRSMAGSLEDSDERYFGRYADLEKPNADELVGALRDSPALFPKPHKGVRETIADYGCKGVLRAELNLRNISSTEGPVLEPLSDWLGFSQLFNQVMRGLASRSSRAAQDDLTLSEFLQQEPYSYPIGIVLPAPSLYGSMLSILSNHIAKSNRFLAVSVYKDALQNSYEVRAWNSLPKRCAPHFEPSGVEAIINLHLSANQTRFDNGTLAIKPLSKASLIYYYAAFEAQEGHLRVCDRPECQNVFFPQRTTARFCSKSCANSSSLQEQRGKGVFGEQ